MLNWAYDKTTFWGNWGLNTIQFWQMNHNQSWKNDFLTSTTRESPMPFGLVVFPIQYAGLRVWIGGAVQELCLVAAGSGATGMGGVPKIRKGGTTYDIYLVEITDGNASPVRMNTTSGIRAIRRRT